MKFFTLIPLKQEKNLIAEFGQFFTRAFVQAQNDD
jgi:hypothetical protein